MKMLLLIGSAIAVALPAGIPAQAQTTVDISKITCEQWLAYKVADPDHIAIWLSGWYAAKKGDTRIEVQALKQTVDRLKDACIRKFNTPLMQVIEEQIGSSK